MRLLERGVANWKLDNEFGDMVERICYFREFFAKDPVLADKYWGFVVRSYQEKGYERSAVDELVAEADIFFDSKGEMPEIEEQFV